MRALSTKVLVSVSWLGAATAVLAGARSGLTCTVNDTADAGGLCATSANYRIDGSLGGVGATAGPADQLRAGYIGQLTEVTNVVVIAAPGSVNEGEATQLGAAAGHDDATVTVVGGGYFNSIQTNAEYATLGGGYNNRVGGPYATVPGGYYNSATGTASFAAGRRAKALHSGAFVWGDTSEADIASTNANSVTLRAAGGYRLFSNSAATLGAQLSANATSWSVMSDRDAKENFAPVDTGAVLDRLAGLPLTEWNYKADPEQRRYIGPMAQDFHAAFGLGDDDRRINTMDTDGVTLAAIQGLYRQVQAEKARGDALERRLAELEKRLQAP